MIVFHLFVFILYIILLSYIRSEDIEAISESLSILKPLIFDRKQVAKQYYDIGINHARNNNYKSALSYLRSACRLDNTSVLYWNDLGVTEMRTRQYQRAKHRFLKAIEIDQSFTTAYENLADIKAYLSSEDYDFGIRIYRQQHKLNKIRIIDYNDLLSASYHNDSILNDPFIIPKLGYMLSWDLMALDITNITKKFGSYRVDFYPHNMLHQHVHPYFTSLADGIRQLLHYPEGVYDDIDVSEPGTYLQWNIDHQRWSELLSSANIHLPEILTDNYWMDICLNSNSHHNSDNKSIIRDDFQLKTHWKMLLIGERNSGMFHHKDTLRSASWQIQVLGRKRWHICSSDDDKKLYHAGDINTFRPDYKKYPKFRNVQTCSDVILEPGDMIFYPHDYWHQTLNMDTPTISLTGTIIFSKNYKFVAEMLKRECDGYQSIFPADDVLCPQLKYCYALWDELYDHSNNINKQDKEL